MDLIVTGVVAGVLGTLVMDFLNHLFARTGMLSKIDMVMIGRMSVGWARGRFRYEHPSEMEQAPNERFYGYITHYTIGVGLAIPFVLGWNLLVGGPMSPVWALSYGVATTVASFFFVFLPWDLEYLAGGLPKALRRLFPAWLITCSTELVWRLRLPLREQRETQNVQIGCVSPNKLLNRILVPLRSTKTG